MKQGLTTKTAAQKRAELKAHFTKGHLVVAPGVFEMVSAKIADQMGFEALYMTGYGTVASYLGMPDAGLASYTDMVNRVSQFVSITDTPLICDGDTGYGGLLNVMHTVRGYEAAGACAGPRRNHPGLGVQAAFLLKLNGHAEIVGAALLAQFVEDGKRQLLV